jgi:hypothetical protein
MIHHILNNFGQYPYAVVSTKVFQISLREDSKSFYQKKSWVNSLSFWKDEKSIMYLG